MNPAQHAVEQVIRDLIADNPDLPIRAQFYRGSSGHAGPLDAWTSYEHAETPGCPIEWFVRVAPNSFAAMVSAAGRLFLGENDVIGRAVEVPLPPAVQDEVDLGALAGSQFHVELLAAIRETAAVVAEMRAAITT